MTNLQKQTVYRQYCVLVDNKDAQHAESDSLSIQAVQKYIYLHIHCVSKKFTLFIFDYSVK